MNEWIVGLLINLVSAVLFEWLRPLVPFITPQDSSRAAVALAPPHLSGAPASSRLPDAVYERRRRSAKDFLAGTLVYMTHFLLIWFTLAVTFWSMGPQRKPIFLDQARVVGHQLPHVQLSTDLSTRTGMATVLVAAALTYVVAWLLALPVVRVGAYFGRHDVPFRRETLLGACLVSYVLAAVHVGWLFTTLGYGEAWLIVGIVSGAIFWLAKLSDRGAGK